MALIGTNIEFADALLKQGKVIAVPTDTVYGIACNALNEAAIEQIYEIKGRDKIKALIAQTYSLKKASSFLEFIPTDGYKLAEAYWPGALTLILHANSNIPKSMIAGGKTVGVRVPNHIMLLELLRNSQYPLAVTSANLSGMPSPHTAEEVNDQLGDRIEYILDGGKSPIGIESTIVGFKDEKPVILRHGAIPEEDIFKVL